MSVTPWVHHDLCWSSGSEAHWLDFEIAVPTTPATASPGLPKSPEGEVCDSWTVSKLGSTFCATDVDIFGSTHLHAVSDTGGVKISSGATALQLRTFDAALVSLEYKSAFPSPVRQILDSGRLAQNAYVYVNLCNNFWTTVIHSSHLSVLIYYGNAFINTDLVQLFQNYPNWYPFMAGDQDASFRFQLVLGS